MLDLANTRAIVTGASRGIGVALADALAARGADLLLVARSQTGLDSVRESLARHGTRVLTFSADLSDRRAIEELVEFAQRELSSIDLLVNNAGVEQVDFYEDLSVAEIEQTIAVNLTAPMVLTRLLLPDMLTRDRGFVLNVASIAGLMPAAFGEPYGATKHGLVGFTRSLRASLQTRSSAVSASVVCPGFISGTGMYQDAVDRYGVVAPPQLGTCTPEAVARACIRAVERDEPQVLVSGKSFRPYVLLGTAMPRAFERMGKGLDANAAFQQVAELRRAERLSDET
jgi:short-subunit dehydrogenase